MASPRLTQPTANLRAAAGDATVTLSSLNLSRATLAERYTLPAFRLRVSAGPDAGKSEVFAQRVVVIGSAPDADFALTDTAASREHIRITGDRVGYRLRDLDSKNGTWFAGSRAIELLLGPAATLRLGQTELQYEQLGELHEIAVARETELWGLQGHSDAMREVFARIAHLAADGRPAAIEGEPGTGKRTAAVAWHRCSPRAAADVETVDCTAVDWSAPMVEWAPGGPGWARCAAGTLVILDVEEIPQEVALTLAATYAQRAESGTAPQLLATLTTSIPAAVREGRLPKEFAKLFAGRRIVLPALRHRPEDIAPLVDGMLAELEAANPEAGPLVLSHTTLRALQSYAWPGNVRELRRHLEAAAGAAVGGTLPLAMPQPAGAMEDATDGSPARPLPFAEARALALRQFERAYCGAALQACGGLVGHAAQLAGMTRGNFESLAMRCGLPDGKS
ncbi:MAG: FHA domain-containing protein [Deltaproteobacteria bacterium]|nr:FHA domain-containing protein [Deltaproteobacteria bacterium]